MIYVADWWERISLLTKIFWWDSILMEVWQNIFKVHLAKISHYENSIKVPGWVAQNSITDSNNAVSASACDRGQSGKTESRNK